MNKGKREDQRVTNKKIIDASKEFNKILMAMNTAYHVLLKDEEATKENIEEKLNNMMEFDFTPKQIQMLKDDLFKES